MTKKTIVHVDQHILKRNRETGARVPPITVKSGRENRRAQRLDILDGSGNVVGRLVYQPDKPLKCNAVVWIELMHTPKLHRSLPYKVAEARSRACKVAS
jgi:hypothetical protein